MWRTSLSSKTAQGGPKPEAVRLGPRPTGQAPVCCGQAMQPRLAQAHDHSGNSLFVVLWRCPQCGKSLY